MLYSGAYSFETDWAFGFETGRIADNIVKGQGFASPCGDLSGSSAWLMPVYPYLVAFAFKVFGSYSEAAAVAILVFNSIASALTCVLIFLVADRLFGRIAAYAAAAAWAVFPPSIWHSVNSIWDTTLFTLLCTLVLYVSFLVTEKATVRVAVLYGLLLGVTALVNASIIAVLPFAFLWLLWKLDTDFVRKTLFLGTAACVFLVTLSPWLLRNYMIFGRWMLRSNFGLELRIGNNERTWQASKMDGKERGRLVHWVREHPCQKEEELDLLARLGEVEYAKISQDEAMSFIKENPEKFVDLTVARFRNFWVGDLRAPKEYKGNIKMPFSVSTLKDLSLLIPLPFMVFGILRAVQRKTPVLLPLSYLLFFPMVYYIVHTHSHRYRHPIEPVIIMFGAYGACSLVALLAARMRRGEREIPGGGP